MPIASPRMIHMIEAIPDRLEGSPRHLGVSGRTSLRLPELMAQWMGKLGFELDILAEIKKAERMRRPA